MQFTMITAAAVLAFASTVSALPPAGTTRSNTKTTSAPSNTKTTSTPSNTKTTSTTSPAYSTSSTPNYSLSLTQQLFLADTRVDFFKLLPKDSDFVFDFEAAKVANPPGQGGQIVAANRQNFPALVGTDTGAAVGFLGACGFNTPHVHPRGTELQLVTKGRLVTEMLPENNVLDANGNRRVITNTVEVNQITPFYQGSVHTQFNPECDDAEFVAFFPSEDFGTGQAADELFAFSNDVVQAVFGQQISGQDVDKFRKFISPNVAQGVEDCLTKCKIPKANPDNGTSW